MLREAQDGRSRRTLCSLESPAAVQGIQPTHLFPMEEHLHAKTGAVQSLGILRLRAADASRQPHSAQDDNFIRPIPRTCSLPLRGRARTRPAIRAAGR